MNTLVSIIIPCYNSESTLEETLQSVFNQDFHQWEALIINDGSPDNLEEIALKWTDKDSRFKYYKKVNGGLGSARNFGVNIAKSKYFLPLDSDNKVRKNFLSSGIEILEKNSTIGVVYGNAKCFGERDNLWVVGEFDKYKMLQHNYIDACAIIRKSLFLEIDGYDENLPYQGHEDWDFWLKVMKTNFQFYYLNQITFDYRVLKNSMINSFTKQMTQENIKYIRKKNYELYINGFISLLKENKKLEQANHKSSLIKIFKKLYK